MEEDVLKKKLTPEQYRVLREKGTEPPFSGKYLNTTTQGVYRCAACETELFSSESKFNSHCGWPAFSSPINDHTLEQHRDHSFGMERIEVTCQSCGSHLGHVFNDGPIDQGGLRYCINSICLDFLKDDA